MRARQGHEAALKAFIRLRQEPALAVAVRASGSIQTG